MVCGPVQVVWHHVRPLLTGTSKCVRCRCPMAVTPMDPASMLERVDEKHHHGPYRRSASTYTRRLRARGSHVERPGQAAGRHRPGYRHSRGRGQRRFPRPVLRPPRSSSTSAFPGSSRSVPRVTNSGWPRWVWGWGVFRDSSELPDELGSTSITSAATCRSSRSTSPRPAGQIIASYLQLPPARP